MATLRTALVTGLAGLSAFVAPAGRPRLKRVTVEARLVAILAAAIAVSLSAQISGAIAPR